MPKCDVHDMELVACEECCDGLRARLARAEQEWKKWKRVADEQLALLDRTDGPPVYSYVLKRAEAAEASLALAVRTITRLTAEGR